MAEVAALLLQRTAAKALTPSRASGLQASGAPAMDVVRAYALAFGLIAACYCVAAAAVWFSARDRDRKQRAWSASGLVLGAGAGACGGVVAFFLESAGAAAPLGYWISPNGGALAIICLVVAGLVAPITGELAFRGVFQEMLSDSLGPSVPALAVAVLYAFIWPLPGTWAGALVIGLAAGYTYAMKRTVLAAIVASAVASWVVICGVAIFGPIWVHP
ncbi:MAG: CPBP family glutamic-type intramembrane protease [Terriglobales bacterium]